MAVDTVQGSVSQNASLFRPRPINELQSNLAQFYERTSRFVNEQFKELIDGQGGEPRKGNLQNSPNDESVPRLKPQGIGTIVDLII